MQTYKDTSKTAHFLSYTCPYNSLINPVDFSLFTKISKDSTHTKHTQKHWKSLFSTTLALVLYFTNISEVSSIQVNFWCFFLFFRVIYPPILLSRHFSPFPLSNTHTHTRLFPSCLCSLIKSDSLTDCLPSVTGHSFREGSPIHRSSLASLPSTLPPSSLRCSQWIGRLQRH